MSTLSKKLMWPKPTQYCARRLCDNRSSWDSIYLSIGELVKKKITF